MKIIKTGLFTIISLFFLANVYASKATLSCSDLTGNWHGSFQPYNSVNLSIIQTYQNQLLSNLTFVDGNMNDGVPNAPGNCQVNADGSLTALFQLSTPLGPVNYTLTMKDPSQIFMQGSIPMYPTFSGALTHS